MTQSPQKPIDYQLVRSRRRSVAIHVRGNTVEVRAPNRVPLYWINEFVHERAAWIEKRLAEEARRHQERYCLINGQPLPYLLRLFQRWMSEQANHYLTPRTEQMAEALNVQHKLASVAFRHTRSKWGHCTHKGVIQFNPMIMLAPPAVANYLVAHEASHLIHPNHSKAYWECVGSICPDHREQRRWLRANEHCFQLRLS